LARKNTSIPVQFEVLLAESRIAIANPTGGFTRRAAESRHKAETALAQAKRCGYLEYQFKLRLLLGEIDTRSGNASQGRKEIEAVQKDAKSHGFGLLARNADALLAKS